MATTDSNVPLKSCTKCKKEYPATLEFFYKQRKSKDGLSWACQTCTKKQVKKYRDEYPEVVRERKRTYHQNHRDADNERSKRWYHDNKEYSLLKSKRWRESHVDWLKAYKHNYYVRNGATIRLRVRDRYHSNPQPVIDYQREYNQRNREAISIRKRRYRAVHLDEIKQKQAVYREQNKDAIQERQREYRQRNREKIVLHSRNARARRCNAAGRHTLQDVQVQYRSQRGRCWWCGKPLDDDYHVDHVIPLSRGGSNNPSNIVISCPHCNLSKGTKLPHEWNGRLF